MLWFIVGRVLLRSSVMTDLSHTRRCLNLSIEEFCSLPEPPSLPRRPRLCKPRGDSFNMRLQILFRRYCGSSDTANSGSCFSQRRSCFVRIGWAQVDRVFHEPDRSVGHCHVDSAGVHARRRPCPSVKIPDRGLAEGIRWIQARENRVSQRSREPPP